MFARLRVREVPPARPEVRSWRRETAEGVRLLRTSRARRRLVATGAFTMVLTGVNGAALYAVVDGGLGKPPAYVGVLYAAQGLGSILAGLLTGPLLRRVPERTLAVVDLALFSVAVGVRALPRGATALAASVVIGLGLPWVLIAVTTAVQREAPPEAVGRMAATAHALVMASTAPAMALGAGLVAVVDVRVLLPLLAPAGLGRVVALLLGAYRGGLLVRGG
ncbi:MFS transporter [Streptomyces sp. NPDC058872]|uniref:MFS transporter n=1 Tax=Streptomyces sp. NPDC058872 TaxID=3346661 RepID=UPI0036B634B0